jgi:hypothetical protein
MVVTKKPPAPLDEGERLKEKLEFLALKEKQVELREGLPFLYGWKWYPWARDFFESVNKLNFLCAANQISKSSTQIRKCIDWATNWQKWPSLWRNKPVQFWYLYPSAGVATAEFRTKWQQFLPKGKYKTEAVIDGRPNFYAWKEEIKNKEIHCIHFFVADLYVFFKSYAQDTQTLQTGTCDAIFCDEELPIEHYDELLMRLSAADGYFHMVFTATLGQEWWRSVIEETGDKEKLVGAYKSQVSMYDCTFYEDGTPSHWTHEKIQVVKNRCKTHNEVLRRVYGRFVVDEGLKYEAFDIKRHVIPEARVPDDWHIYGGVDIGSGGEKGHPAAIVFCAVRPDYRAGRVFLGWRGDGIPTTASDVVEKFIELKKAHELNLTAQYYDHASKDFFEISSRMGEPFQPADKAHDKGEAVINVLFKNNMLFLSDTPELEKLAWELTNLRLDTPKTKAKDDFTDALRYAITRIPWDWSAIVGAKPEGWLAPEPVLSEGDRINQARRKAFEPEESDGQRSFEEEISEWNDLYG